MIAKRVRELGAQITQDFAGQSVILVGVLKGAAIFLSDLARQVDLDCHLRFHWRLQLRQPPQPNQELKSGWDSTGEVKLTKDVDQSMKDKNVIVVEDILDTGLTLTFLRNCSGAPAANAEDRGPARQTFATQAAAGRRLCRLQDSR